MEMEKKIWEQVLEENDRDPLAVMEMLLEIQEKSGYVSIEAAYYLADELGLDPEEVCAMGSYYRYFLRERAGRYRISLCSCQACHNNGSDRTLRALRAELGLWGERETTTDKQFTVRMDGKTQGLCGQGPMLRINDITCPSMTPLRALMLIRALKNKKEDASLLDVVRRTYEEYGRDENETE